jgi:hypothetical protein
MSNEKKKALLKKQRQPKKTATEETNITDLLSNKEAVSLYIAVIICAFALVAYFTFFK